MKIILDKEISEFLTDYYVSTFDKIVFRVSPDTSDKKNILMTLFTIFTDSENQSNLTYVDQKNVVFKNKSFRKKKAYFKYNWIDVRRKCL